MKSLLLATTAIIGLGMGAAPAQQIIIEDNGSPADVYPDAPPPPEPDAAVGAGVGGVAGAAGGAAVGGPIGAVIGGFAGAVIGSASTVPRPAVGYVIAHPAPTVVFRDDVRAGMVIPETVGVQQIPDYPRYGYVYADGRPVIVRMASRRIVYSPGYAVPRHVETYVETNPVPPAAIEGDIEPGAEVPSGVDLAPIPQSPTYAYVYTRSGPVIVNRVNRTVIWSR